MSFYPNNNYIHPDNNTSEPIPFNPLQGDLDHIVPNLPTNSSNENYFYDKYYSKYIHQYDNIYKRTSDGFLFKLEHGVMVLYKKTTNRVPFTKFSKL